MGWQPHKEDEVGMTLLINSYSFVAIGFLIVLIVALMSWRLLSPKWAAVTVAVTFAALVAFQLTASTKVDTVSSPEDFNSALASGKPVLLELYSNF